MAEPCCTRRKASSHPKGQSRGEEDLDRHRNQVQQCELGALGDEGTLRVRGEDTTNTGQVYQMAAGRAGPSVGDIRRDMRAFRVALERTASNLMSVEEPEPGFASLLVRGSVANCRW